MSTRQRNRPLEEVRRRSKLVAVQLEELIQTVELFAHENAKADRNVDRRAAITSILTGLRGVMELSVSAAYARVVDGEREDIVREDERLKKPRIEEDHEEPQ